MSIEAQASLEATLKDEIFRMYDEVAENPSGKFHFFHGREAAELFGYDREALDEAPAGAVASFAGVGNPHLRAEFQPGEVVLDLGSGAGLDAIMASRRVGPTGRVIGVDMNPAMCRKVEAHATASGQRLECRQGTMEEMFRVLKPGGRISITDIVSGKQLSQNIVNDPKLWAS